MIVSNFWIKDTITKWCQPVYLLDSSGGKEEKIKNMFFRTWIYNLFFQNYNILSFSRFFILIFIMSYTDPPAKVLAWTTLCQSKPGEFQKLPEEIWIPKLKFTPLSVVKRAALLIIFSPQPALHGCVTGTHFWIGILGFPNKCWDISAPHKSPNSPLAPRNPCSSPGMTDLLLSCCKSNSLRDRCKVLAVLSTKT